LAKKATRKRARTTPAKRKTASNRTAPKRTARKKSAARAAATRRRRTKPAPPKSSRIKAVASAVRGTVAGAAAAVSKRLRGAKSEPDAIELLEAEHRRFEQLLAQGEETTDRARKTRRELLTTLTDALNAHELMEEKVLYPALQSHPQARDIVLEGYEEHHVADLIVKELHEVATDDEAWGAKFKVLKENIEHHIEEEEGEMFRTARGIFSRDELRELAERMRAVRGNGDKRA
jgi:hypothetical protein